MRKPLGGRVPKIISADLEASVGAPVGGLNSRDALAQMPATDALILENFVCRPTKVEARKGQSAFVTGFGATEKVWSLLPYRTAPNDRLFAGTDLGIYEVTNAGTVGAIVSASTNGKWESVFGVNAGISYIVAVNATDNAKLFNGTVWADAAITGVASNTLSNLHQFKFRLYFTQKDTLDMWYLATNAVQGAATKFPLGPIFRKGGSLLAIDSWTIDGGDGIDDYIVFLTTEGEAAIYKGTDPSVTATWALVGVYSLPRPIGRKCMYKYGGDLIVITDQGVVRMSKMLDSVVINRDSSLSDKVMGEIGEYASLYKANFGWSLMLLSVENLLILNVPVIEGNSSIQFVMNTLTGAWSKFTGMNAFCMLEFGARLFMGGMRQVFLGMSGFSDFSSNITLKAKTAYFAPGGRLKTKQVKLLRPNFTTSKSITVQLSIAVNYEGRSYVSPSSTGSNGLSIFDTSTWDNATWVGSDYTVASWRSVAHNPGYTLALLLQVDAKDYSFSWNTTDFLLTQGSVIG